MYRTWGVLALWVMAVVAIVTVGSFYLHLGMFMPIPYVAGLLLSVGVALRQRGAVSHPRMAVAAAGVAYVLLQALASSVATTERTAQRTMTWEVDSSSAPPEVVLRFAEHPGHFLTIYSSDLADHLRSTASREVHVELEVTRDLGCLRGFHATRIGELTAWGAGPGGHAGSAGSATSPWSNPWWCP